MDCDGETIAGLSPHGVVSRHNAETGAFIGQMQPGSGCIGVPSHTGRFVLVQSLLLVRRYNARIGVFLGQNKF
ncbi:MAG: hypothetical protein WCO97_09490 [bacterium]